MSSRVRRGGFALALTLLACATVAVPRPVLAQGKKAPPATAPKDPKLADAKKLFDEGALAYGRGDYEQAIKLWDQSYALSQQPLILYNLANAWEKLGDFKKTRDNLGKWREAAPPEEREMLDLRLKNLDARIEREEEAARKAAAEKAAREAQQRASVPVAPDRSWVPGTIVAGVGAASGLRR
jgi:tetratricopeptide (TPR) repeat protein